MHCFRISNNDWCYVTKSHKFVHHLNNFWKRFHFRRLLSNRCLTSFESKKIKRQLNQINYSQSNCVWTCEKLSCSKWRDFSIYISLLLLFFVVWFNCAILFLYDKWRFISYKNINVFFFTFVNLNVIFFVDNNDWFRFFRNAFFNSFFIFELMFTFRCRCANAFFARNNFFFIAKWNTNHIMINDKHLWIRRMQYWRILFFWLLQSKRMTLSNVNRWKNI